MCWAWSGLVRMKLELGHSLTQWYQKLQHCGTDNALWTWAKDKVKVILLVYVDDLTLACNNLSAFTQCKTEFQSKFKMRDLLQVMGLQSVPKWCHMFLFCVI